MEKEIDIQEVLKSLQEQISALALEKAILTATIAALQKEPKPTK